jgi:hypothetical protein
MEAESCIVDRRGIAGNMASIGHRGIAGKCSKIVHRLVGVVSRCCANIGHMSRDRSMYMGCAVKTSCWVVVGDESRVKDRS